MSQPHFDPRGAVDLSMLQKPTPAQEAAAANSQAAARQAPAGVIVDLSPENFQQVVESSATVPVIVAIGASRTAAGEQMTPSLEQAAVAARGVSSWPAWTPTPSRRSPRLSGCRECPAPSP